RLIFGASTAASAAVLAIFVGGLGAGSIWLGPRADRHTRPLLLYAQLETLIAIFAALTPALLWLVRLLYVALGGSVVLGTFRGTLARAGALGAGAAPADGADGRHVAGRGPQRRNRRGPRPQAHRRALRNQHAGRGHGGGGLYIRAARGARHEAHAVGGDAGQP